MSYDPLHAISPGEGLDHVDSYWAATAGPSPGDDGRLQSTIETDVAIIGGGYTGLSCAFHLAKPLWCSPCGAGGQSACLGLQWAKWQFCRTGIGSRLTQ